MEFQRQTATYILDFLIGMGVPQNIAIYVKLILLIALLTLAVVLVDLLTRKILINTLHRFAATTKSKWDDYLIESKATNNLSHIIPSIIILQAVPFVFEDFARLVPIAIEVMDVYIIILVILLIRSGLNGTKAYLKTRDSFKDKPIDSYVQVVNIVLYFIAGILIFSELTGKDVWTFFTALGAASAVLLLIFRDTIMGFVASIQMSSFDMVRVGDWISMPAYGADGDVLEINLTTVKVQNWDMTITTIPTYALISNSFKNWRGMQRSGGRRIKRALHIKQGSVRFLEKDDLPKFKQIQYLSHYIDDRQSDIDAYNEKKGADKSLPINGRNLTNLGLFRKYMTEYLENHSALNKEMTLMVRQLEPTDKGIPLEIYCFSSDKRWVNYEYIIADIFDHALASIPFFELELFESPSGTDFQKLKA